MQFDSLGLMDELLEAIHKQGYKEASPIQEQAIPAVLSGRDIMAAAQTGTGKTAAFTLPILQQLSQSGSVKPKQVRALILTPTRELAAQILASVEAYGKNLSLSSAVVFGGVKASPQIARLANGIDILVATPGRLLDLHQQGAVNFSALEVLVLDEADRMLDMGFIHDIRKIMATLPKKRQNLLFSATFSQDIRKLASSFINNPVEVSVNTSNSTAKTVKQWIVPVDKRRKTELLMALVELNAWTQVLVFSRTKHGADKITRTLVKNKISAMAIHGNKSQNARIKALAAFKDNKVQVLVATDIAARGIDIDQLPQVVNFDLPDVAEDYVHRIGRTGRAGQTGTAISLVCADEIKQLSDIERLIGHPLERRLQDGFEPEHDLPASGGGQRRPASRPNHKNAPRRGRGNDGGQGPKRGSGKPSDGRNRRGGHAAKSGGGGRGSGGNSNGRSGNRNSGSRNKPR